MPWDVATQSFIRQNTDFSGPTVWQQDAQATIKIIASRHDNHDQDLANGISQCLNLDGINAMRAALDMGSNTVNNVDDAGSANQAPNKGQMDSADAVLQGQIDSNDSELADHESRLNAIETADPYKVNALVIAGYVRQLSNDVAGSGTASMSLDTGTANRWRAVNNVAGGVTLNILPPTGATVMTVGPVEEYTAEGTILFTNGATPGVVSLQLGGVAVNAADVLGGSPLTANTRYLLTYIIHRLAGDVYDDIYIWSAVS